MLSLRLLVYPYFNAHYYSFYIQELYKKFRKLTYSNKHFPEFHHHCLAFIIEGKNQKKVYISAGDGSGFNTIGLEWCDIYAKVNVNNKLIPTKHKKKVIPIGPSFGVQYLNGFGTLVQSIITYSKSLNTLDTPREHIANYYRQWKYRLPLPYFKPGSINKKYIFHASTLWKKEKDTNIHRANFINVASNLIGIHFEGGFAPGKEESIKGFEQLIMNEKFSFIHYLNNIKKSVVVFNTPAVQGCFGWKLGEYLALGKAIISTKNSNMLPSPLIHGKHIHYVDGSKDSIKSAIIEIMANKPYRKTLEKNARKYYLKYLSPSSVIQRIIDL